MKNILVVEDSAVDRALIEGLLSQQTDWRIQFANDGQAGLDSISTFSPDLILTDMRMPVLNGLELVKEVRQRYPQLPIVLATSFGSEQIAIEALRSGATSYTPKSLLKSDLVRTITQVLTMSEQMQYEQTSDQQPKRKQLAFVIKNESSLIGPTIEHVQENLPAWSDRDRLQIGMALDEAIINAMHHGNLEVDSKLRESEEEKEYYNLIRSRKTLPPFSARRVHIEAELSDQHICIQITDDGQGFDPKLIPDPTSEENLHRLSGRGLFLIRSFMDQVTHNSAGNQITMTKLRQD